MGFNFVVKDENLLKPTILSVLHILSLLLGLLSFSKYLNVPTDFIISFSLLLLIQTLYLAIFYRKIVWERYSNVKLRAITTIFIFLNLAHAVIVLLGVYSGNFISLHSYLFLLSIVIVISIFFVLYVKDSFINKIMPLASNFTFPHYKYAAAIPIFILIPIIFTKNSLLIGISLLLLLFSSLYTVLGEYRQTKRKDELDRLIKFEASYLSIQLMSAFFFPLYLMGIILKISIPWFYIMFIFLISHTLFQAIINKRYE
jgi:hypothetical protein